MARWTFLPLLAAVALSGLPAAAQTLTVNITNVNSSEGHVFATICDDPAGPFPGVCNTGVAMTNAVEGTTTVKFLNVSPGAYAFQAFHDANGDMMPNIPTEGFAFGNDAPFPVSFEAASLKVDGNTTATARMTYLGNRGAATDPGPERSQTR